MHKNETLFLYLAECERGVVILKCVFKPMYHHYSNNFNKDTLMIIYRDKFYP